MVVLPEKQMYGVIANVQAKLESKKCQLVEPVSATTGTFIVLLRKFSLAFVNSTLVAIAVTAFQIFTSALVGYAFARLKFRGRQALLLGAKTRKSPRLKESMLTKLVTGCFDQIFLVIPCYLCQNYERERKQGERERRRAERLAEQLRALSVEPDFGDDE
jgi:hypothetical protein